jgi:hypothetical protein
VPETGDNHSPSGWAGSLAVVPGILFALLPRGTCPVCLAAYSSLLSALGVGALYQARLVAPLTLAFLGVGVIGTAWSSRHHRRWGPLVTTLAGSAAVVAGRFLWDLPALVYLGVAFLIAASVWNLRLRHRVSQPLVQIGGIPEGSDSST